MIPRFLINAGGNSSTVGLFVLLSRKRFVQGRLIHTGESAGRFNGEPGAIGQFSVELALVGEDGISTRKVRLVLSDRYVYTGRKRQ